MELPYLVEAQRREPIAAIVCPAQWWTTPERLLGAEAGKLYVIQDDISRVSEGLLASLEWASANLGVDLAVIFGSPAIRDELAVQMAPRGMKIVRGVVGPNEVVRFEPPLEPARLAQMCKSKKTV